MRRVLVLLGLACAMFVGISAQPHAASAWHGGWGGRHLGWGGGHHHGWGGGHWGGVGLNVGFGFPRYACGYRSFGYSYGNSPIYYGGYYPAYNSCYSPYSYSTGYSYPTTVLSVRPVIVLPPRAAATVPAPAVVTLLRKPAVAEAKVRESSREARRRADRYVELGDKLFAKQKYQEALQQYKSATSAAPDMASTYFRQGFALLATNRYDMAATSFRRGLAVEPGYVADDFRLHDVYGENRLAKASHLESLAGVALDQPTRSDLLFAVGIFLHYDGQLDRARKFFHRTAELTGPEDKYVSLFLSDSPTIPVVARIADGSDI